MLSGGIKMTKEITQKSLGKHIGHACEGHLRGLLKRIISGSDNQVLRALPFDFHVNPDAVICNGSNIVRLVMVVAFWNDSKSSEKKFYRTRSEYIGAQKARHELFTKFTSNAQIITVIYGAEGGWKNKILADLKSQCTPCLYLPEILGINECDQLVSNIFTLYRHHWESGSSKSREYVEDQTANKSELTATEQHLISLLESFLDSKDTTTISEKNTAIYSTTSVRIPSSEIRTRYRQSLGILSLFTNEEISSWKNRSDNKIISGKITDFAYRANFLDVAELVKVKSIGKSWFKLQPKEPFRQVGTQSQYAPDLLDFINWEEIALEKLFPILDAHRELTRNPGSVFGGGAFDQITGNWKGICSVLDNEIPRLLHAINAQDRQSAAKLLSSCTETKPELWHPAAHSKVIAYPLWAFSVCALAISRQDRKVRSDFDARRQQQPSLVEAINLVDKLLGNISAIYSLEEMKEFSARMLQGQLEEITKCVKPRLLRLNEPCSWISDLYNTLTTNSSHNPLAGPIYKWIKMHYPNHKWFGWPKRRSVTLSQVLGSNVGRRQWQFIGKSDKSPQIVAVEVKSITGNHWGDKSKEIYDRVAESRLAANSMNLSLKCIGVLDGDIGREQFKELESRIGYDEVYSITEIVSAM